MEVFLGVFASDWEREKAARLYELEREKRRRGRAAQDVELAFQAAGGRAADLDLRIPDFGRKEGRGGVAPQKASNGVARPMVKRLAGLAGGSQPAVVKMASYGGGARLGAMVNYVSREGAICVETETGEVLEGKESLARIRGDWDHLMGNRAESRDIGNFNVSLDVDHKQMSDAALEDLVRDTLTSGFGDRRFAYGIERRSGSHVAVTGVVVLRSGQGERLTADAKAAAIVQERFEAGATGVSARFAFGGYGNGVEYGTSRVRALVERFEGDVRDDRGRQIGDERAAGDLVQKEWRGELHSRKSRDVMHLIMSARAGTDVEAFERAARDFLAEQFAKTGHRYIFSMHDPSGDPKTEDEGGKRPHVHAHAIVTMRSEFGDRLTTNPQVFREWREVMAEKARAHGIAMEMTDRRETASPPAYSRTQVRPTSRKGRTEHVGTSDRAQERYDAKRAGKRQLATSARSQVYTVKAKQAWRELAQASGDYRVVSFAVSQWNRLESNDVRPNEAREASIIKVDFGSKARANMVTLQRTIMEGEDTMDMTRREFEAYEKRVETALFNLERSIEPDQRSDFDEIANAARDVVNVRREIIELREEKEQQQLQAADGRDRPDQGADDAEWRAAIEKHGEAAVEAGSEALNRIHGLDMAIEDLSRPEPVQDPQTGAYTYEMSEQDRQKMEQLRSEAKEKLGAAIEHAASLAVAGNTYIREAAQEDPQLAQAIETAERADRPVDNRFRLSEANSERVEHFATAAEAGRAFADADPNMRPSVVERVGEGARILARTVQIGEEIQKSVTTVEQVRNDPANYDSDGRPNETFGKSNIDFWTAYHEREAEKGRLHEGSERGEAAYNQETREAHDLVERHEATKRLDDRVERDKDVSRARDDAAQTDPAKQRVPRLDEIEREQRQEKERDRDDRER